MNGTPSGWAYIAQADLVGEHNGVAVVEVRRALARLSSAGIRWQHALCGHIPFVEEGQRGFSQMPWHYGIVVPETQATTARHLLAALHREIAECEARTEGELAEAHDLARRQQPELALAC